MIYFDITKASRSQHHSGLQRVSSRLRLELGERAETVVWENGQWGNSIDRTPLSLTPTDWLVTPELFSEAERPGFWQWLNAGWPARCRVGAIFHDAIPLKFPQWTWPQSVARHPEYLKMLASFDRVFAVSEASRRELTEFWRWQGVEAANPVGRIELGADVQKPPERREGLSESSREPGDAVGPINLHCNEHLNTRAREPRLLSIGILEPRKNQTLLLDVAEQLIARGVRFHLDVVGRVNPHFGNPIAQRLRRMAARYSEICYHGPASDDAVERLWRTARASVFPTLAEGCGLPLLESLARGVPCVASDLPVLRETGEGGGCLFEKVDAVGAWTDTLQKILTDDTLAGELAQAATSRSMPTWAQAADQLLANLS